MLRNESHRDGVYYSASLQMHVNRLTRTDVDATVIVLSVSCIVVPRSHAIVVCLSLRPQALLSTQKVSAACMGRSFLLLVSYELRRFDL
jgi:hypothetical protein